MTKSLLISELAQCFTESLIRECNESIRVARIRRSKAKTLESKLAYIKEVQRLERERSELRRRSFDIQDEIEERLL